MISEESAWLTPLPHVVQQQEDHFRSRTPTNQQSQLQIDSYSQIQQTGLIAFIHPTPKDPTSSADLRLDVHPFPNHPNLILPDPNLAVKTIPTSTITTIVSDKTESTTTESTEAEDELTLKTLSSITAAITTIKEIKRESQLIENTTYPVKYTQIPSPTTTPILTTQLTKGVSTFYRPTPTTPSIDPQVLCKTQTVPPLLLEKIVETNLFPIQPLTTTPQQSISNTTFYLQPPLTVTAETVSSIPQISSPVTETQSTISKTQTIKSASSQCIEIPVTFINTTRACENITPKSVTPSIASEPLAFSQLSQSLYPKIQSKIVKQETDTRTLPSSSTFHVSTKLEKTFATPTEIEAPVSISTKDQTKTTNTIAEIVSIASTITSPQNCGLTQTTVAVAPVHHHVETSAVFYDTPVVAPTNIRVR